MGARAAAAGGEHAHGGRAAPGVVPGAGAQRRLLAAVVHAALAVAVAGRGQGRVPRPRHGRGHVRHRRAVAARHLPPAERDFAQGVPAGGAEEAGVYEV